MKLLDNENKTIIINSDNAIENIKKILIYEYVDHIDNNILDNKIYDTKAIITTSYFIQSIKLIDTIDELKEYADYIGWKLVY